MKSFKNFYIRNNNLTQLQNTSFESPLITTNSFLYYNSFSQTQKDNFKWTAGGNYIDPQGPVLSNGLNVWSFTNPYPSGNQCIGLQSSSFIQQSMYLASGQHSISLYYHTRPMYDANPINILIDNTIIGTVGSVAANYWAFFTQTFTIPISGIVVVKLEGISTSTTGIDNIIVV